MLSATQADAPRTTRWRPRRSHIAVASVTLVVGLLAGIFGPFHGSAPAPHAPTAAAPAGCTAKTVKVLHQAFDPVVVWLQSQQFEIDPAGDPTTSWYPDARACEYSASLVNYHSGITLDLDNGTTDWNGNTVYMRCHPPAGADIATQAAVAANLIKQVVLHSLLQPWASQPPWKGGYNAVAVGGPGGQYYPVLCAR
jgi:hypothetical protein